MRIGFFRHGPAEDEEPRPLTKKGRRKVREAAKALKDLEIRRIVTSPLPRALQSAEILRKALDLPMEVDDRLKPGGPLLFEDGVVLVGHEPDFSTAVRKLTGARIRLRKAGFAWVEDDILLLLI